MPPLAILAGVLVLGGLSWWFWPAEAPRLATDPTSTRQPAPADEETSTGSLANTDPAPSAGVPEPLAQAAALKLEAVAVAREVVGSFPESAISYALLGSAYYNIGQSKEAVGNLNRCLELDPRQVEAYEILARVAYERGELEEAVRLCEEGLKRAPPNPEVLNRLGRAQLDLGRTEEAIRAFERTLELPRHPSETYYLLGQAYLQAGDYPQAKESLRKATALTPDHTQAFFGLFTVCLRLGQPEEAAGYREQFLKLEAIDRRSLTDRSAEEDTLTGLPLVRETVARTFFGAGQIYRFHKQPEKAAELFLRVATLDPGNGAARAALEGLYVQTDTLTEGVRVFEQLTADQPDGSLNHLFLARLQGRLGRTDAAERSYRKVVELSPDWPDGYRGLAELYLRSGQKPAEAKALARRVVEMEPSGAAYYLLAFACVKNDDRPGALAAMEQAVTLSPNNPQFRKFLEELKKAP